MWRYVQFICSPLKGTEGLWLGGQIEKPITFKNKEQNNIVRDIPEHILINIFSYVCETRHEVLTLRLVNTCWKEAAEHTYLWNKFSNDFDTLMDLLVVPDMNYLNSLKRPIDFIDKDTGKPLKNAPPSFLIDEDTNETVPTTFHILQQFVENNVHNPESSNLIDVMLEYDLDTLSCPNSVDPQSKPLYSTVNELIRHKKRTWYQSLLMLFREITTNIASTNFHAHFYFQYTLSFVIIIVGIPELVAAAYGNVIDSQKFIMAITPLLLFEGTPLIANFYFSVFMSKKYADIQPLFFLLLFITLFTGGSTLFFYHISKYLSRERTLPQESEMFSYLPKSLTTRNSVFSTYRYVMYHDVVDKNIPIMSNQFIYKRSYEWRLKIFGHPDFLSSKNVATMYSQIAKKIPYLPYFSIPLILTMLTVDIWLSKPQPFKHIFTWKMINRLVFFISVGCSFFDFSMPMYFLLLIHFYLYLKRPLEVRIEFVIIYYISFLWISAIHGEETFISMFMLATTLFTMAFFGSAHDIQLVWVEIKRLASID